MSEFVSKLEEIMPAIELNFEPTPSFGEYKQYLEHAISHPAKANTKLLEFLVLNFTEEGDVVLDPMAGSGSTGVVAALHGRNAIQIDIEPKFYEFMEKARENVEKASTLAPKGWIKNILGDARHLSKLLEQVDICITSPPYSDTISRQGGPTQVKNVGVSTITAREYSPNPENIGNLPIGDVDAIITSPPFGDCQHDYKHGLKVLGPNFRGRKAWESRLKIETSLDNIGNLSLGNVDVIITSPPYEDGLSHRRHHTPNTGRTERLWAEKHLGAYPDSGDNIGSLKSSGDEYQALSEGRIQELAKKLTKNGKPTYLSEMLKVYHEMYKVLKPSGKAIIIVKPFIRDKKVVDLPYYTYLLMSYCGFVLEKLYKLRLKNKSFWRLLYSKKYPNVPFINHEYILVCRKT
jgi:DNA modification methylase